MTTSTAGELSPAAQSLGTVLDVTARRAGEHRRAFTAAQAAIRAIQWERAGDILALPDLRHAAATTTLSEQPFRTVYSRAQLLLDDRGGVPDGALRELRELTLEMLADSDSDDERAASFEILTLLDTLPG